MAELIWTRRYSFQSVHTLEQVRERRHGHEYFLEVSVRGGDLNEVDSEVHAHVISKLHGHELREFKHATGEYIVDGIHERLLQTSIGPRVCAVALQETRKNRFVSRLSEVRFV